jgi:hypothetical protein
VFPKSLEAHPYEWDLSMTKIPKKNKKHNPKKLTKILLERSQNKF